MATFNIYNYKTCQYLGSIEKSTFETQKDSTNGIETYEEWFDRILKVVEEAVHIDEEKYKNRFSDALKLIFVDNETLCPELIIKFIKQINDIYEGTGESVSVDIHVTSYEERETFFSKLMENYKDFNQKYVMLKTIKKHDNTIPLKSMEVLKGLDTSNLLKNVDVMSQIRVNTSLPDFSSIPRR